MTKPDYHAESALLSAMLADSYTYLAVRQITHWKDFQDKRFRKIAQAIWECAEQHETINRANVLSRLRESGIDEGQIPDKMIVDLDDAGVQSIVQGAMEYATRIGRIARHDRLVYRARQFADSLALHPDEEISLREELLGGLLVEEGNGQQRDANILSILDAPQAPREAYPTGFVWLDNLAVGFSPAHVWGISGRYKGRKTTLALGLILRALRNKIPSLYLVTEGTREGLVNRLLCMLATGRMRASGIDSSEWVLKADRLGQAWQSEAQHIALSWAKEQLREVPLWVYDNADRVQELETSVNLIRQHAVMNGVKIAVVDYLQQVEPIERRGSGWQDNPFERTVKGLQNVTTAEQITTILLSQRNEERNKAGTRSVRTAGAKGGGAFPSACDYYLETEYNELESPTMFTVTMAFSRWSGVGSKTYTMNPSSGLILNPSSK